MNKFNSTYEQHGKLLRQEKTKARQLSGWKWKLSFVNEYPKITYENDFTKEQLLGIDFYCLCKQTFKFSKVITENILYKNYSIVTQCTSFKPNQLLKRQ